VKAVGLSQWIPLGLTGQAFIDLRDREAPGASAIYRVVNEDFFNALRIPLVAGRVFDRRDALNTPRVALVNQTMARKYWPGESPLGKQVRVPGMERGVHGAPPAWITVVGVVGDVRTHGLETDPGPELYADFRQVPSFTYGMTALVRGPASATQLTREIRRAAHEADAHVPVDVGTLEQLLERTLGARSLTLSLLSMFAAAALVLAALGIYGVLSYSVAQRTRELAVRAALGAVQQDLLRLVLRSGMRVVVTGMIIGLGAAAVLMRTLDAMLFGVSHNDAVSYVAAIVAILVVCVAAILIPARRAMRLDPMIALQAE
jgi:putative ABC transport system permease protein